MTSTNPVQAPNVTETPDQYRFSGYQLDMLILDETGPAYAYVHPHPYYYNQPKYWEQNSFQNGQIIGGDIKMDKSGGGVSEIFPISNGVDSYTQTEFPLMNV